MSKVFIWIFTNLLKSRISSYIIEAYRRTADQNLVIRTEIVKVKKGKNRYDLAFFETKEGIIKFNLSRHFTYFNSGKVEIEGELIKANN